MKKKESATTAGGKEESTQQLTCYVILMKPSFSHVKTLKFSSVITALLTRFVNTTLTAGSSV